MKYNLWGHVIAVNYVSTRICFEIAFFFFFLFSVQKVHFINKYEIYHTKLKMDLEKKFKIKNNFVVFPVLKGFSNIFLLSNRLANN